MTRNSIEELIKSWRSRSHFKSFLRQIMIQAIVKNPSYTTSDLSYRTNNLR